MTTAATMLDASHHLPPLDTQLHGDTIDVLTEASRTTRQCAQACLREGETQLSRCIALDQDAAEITAATAGVLIRLAEPDSARAALRASRAALRACGSECRRHAAHLPHCARCAEVCERAEDLCVRMGAAIANLVVIGGRVVPAPVTPTDPRHTTLGHIDVTSSSADGGPPIHLIADGDIGEGAD